MKNLINLLDDAIEACEKIEIEEDREIKVTGRLNRCYLIIHVINKTQERELFHAGSRH